ncbi:MAG: translation initiation factor IF-1 [Clostridia bacterium]|nr:translation initiation factor IF-1 [Clostridia bacterium]
MSKEDLIEMQGKVIEVMAYQQYRIELEPSHRQIIAYPSGKMRTRSIKIIEGDSVRVELSPYDLTKGRIVWRDKN